MPLRMRRKWRSRSLVDKRLPARCRWRASALTGIAAFALVGDSAHTAGALQPGALPDILNSYFTTSARLAASERAALLAGRPVLKPLDAEASKEVAMAGAVWIEGRPETYVRLVRDIERFESGGAFRVTKRIGEPPQLADFDALRLPEDDVASLKSCRVGDCELKVSAEMLERMRQTIDFSKPTAARDADALARQIAFEFVTGYQQGGNDRLAVYRDSSRPTFVATEFRTLIDRMPELGEHLPELRAYLLDYPRVSLPTATSFLYWQEAQFGLKPTIRISHVVIDDRPEVTAVASKLLYASHYFWTALDLRVLVPDRARGRGFWFVNVTRSRSDGLSGFVGTIIRGRVRTEAQKGLEAVLNETKARVERAER